MLRGARSLSLTWPIGSTPYRSRTIRRKTSPACSWPPGGFSATGWRARRHEPLGHVDKTALLAQAKPQVHVLERGQLLRPSASRFERATAHHEAARYNRPERAQHVVECGRALGSAPTSEPLCLSVGIDDCKVAVGHHALRCSVESRNHPRRHPGLPPVVSIEKPILAAKVGDCQVTGGGGAAIVLFQRVIRSQ